MVDTIWELTEGDSPLAAAAIHHGNEVRAEVASRLALSPAERLREEDPHTGPWTRLAETRIVVRRSRFEIDLNRARAKAAYIKPEDAWGLRVWKDGPPAPLIERSLSEYDAFYAEARRVLASLKERFGRFVLLDLHTYNHRRAGPEAPPDDPAANPEVNVGTGTMDRGRWAAVVDRFIRDLRAFDFGGRRLDVRENVRFRGGNFPRWIHQAFPDSGCALAVEVKKFFMDEWTGEVDTDRHALVARALGGTVPGIIEELRIMGSKG